MKTIQVTTKAKANKIVIESLFKPVNGRTLNTGKYCTGKYKPDAFPVGREIEVPDWCYAVWAEKRTDSDGKYAALFCVSSI